MNCLSSNQNVCLLSAVSWLGSNSTQNSCSHGNQTCNLLCEPTVGAFSLTWGSSQLQQLVATLEIFKRYERSCLLAQTFHTHTKTKNCTILQKKNVRSIHISSSLRLLIFQNRWEGVGEGQQSSTNALWVVLCSQSLQLR